MTTANLEPTETGARVSMRRPAVFAMVIGNWLEFFDFGVYALLR